MVSVQEQEFLDRLESQRVATVEWQKLHRQQNPDLYTMPELSVNRESTDGRKPELQNDIRILLGRKAALLREIGELERRLSQIARTVKPSYRGISAR